jgi:hypothetical protein
MVTGVRNNQQHGDLEAGEGTHYSTPFSSRTQTKMTIPGIRSRPVTSAEALEHVDLERLRAYVTPIFRQLQN